MDTLKKLFYLFLLVSCFTSCKDKTPHELINAYITAVEHNDSEKINEYYNNSFDYWINKYNKIKINTSNVTLPKHEVLFSDTATHSQKLSIKTKHGKNAIFWNIEKPVKGSPKIVSTYGLVSLDTEKIEKDFGLELFGILSQTDEATVLAVNKLNDAISCVKNIIAQDDSWTNYVKKIGIQDYDCYLPKEFKDVSVYVERNPNYPKTLIYYFTINQFQFKVKYEKNIFELINTKGVVDHSTLSIDPGECWDAQLNEKIAEYKRTAPYREAGVAFSKFELPFGTLYQGSTTIKMTGKNYSNKTIKYLEVTFMALNSVNDIVTTDRYQREIMIRGIGPIEPGEIFSYTFEPSWGVDSKLIDRVICIGVCSRYTDGTFKAGKFIMEN